MNSPLPYYESTARALTREHTDDLPTTIDTVRGLLAAREGNGSAGRRPWPRKTKSIPRECAAAEIPDDEGYLVS
ncbi:hypothetical protein [Streptomyces violascens]|uniref:Uncharacterized protein n=1 Tax=Streptomyces violascens TaxID=67381 RepID=A0ABQ3QWT1_9ACTN|nr:hypothetical protein [Streptomyces violascens]GGU12000.1 hypothetical protein GCM10010289_36700 [Streptomyces violascens]GHI41721.1 hypothetical protein Sviol_61290 [Streptomyces violascens]